MPPDRQDADQQLDTAPDEEPEVLESARGGGRRSRKRKRRTARKRGGDGARHVVDLDADAPAVDTPAQRERIVAGVVALASEGEPTPDAGAPGSRQARSAEEASEESSRRRARVAAYADPGDAQHTPSDLEAVADLARELAQLSTPETRSRLLAEAVAHAEAKEARYRVPLAEPGAELRWKAPLALALFLAAALVAVAPPAWVVPPPTAQIDAADRLDGIRVALLLQAQQVEAFRAREQRLPDSLDDVGVRLADIRFIRSGSRAYQLVGYTQRGEAVVYDPSDPGAAFEGLAASWSLARDAQ